MLQTPLPKQVGEEDIFIVGQVFERFASQCRRQNELHAFALPNDSRLVKCRMNECVRLISNLDQMCAAGNQGTKKKQQKAEGALQKAEACPNWRRDSAAWYRPITSGLL